MHWCILTWSIKEAFLRLCFLLLSVYGEQVLPSISNCPLFLSANVHGIDISFIIPSKLSLFPSLSFIISTVSSETDAGDCQLAFVCQCQPHPPKVWACTPRPTGPISYAALCPHIEICHYWQKSSRWAQISCRQTSCVCVVAAERRVGRPGQERKPGPEHRKANLTRKITLRLFTKISMVLKWNPAWMLSTCIGEQMKGVMVTE